MATVTASPAPSVSGGARRRALALAMARTGAGSFLSGLLSTVATKTIAAVAGPSGVALLATLQQTRQTALIAATANGQAALVQGISARSGIERREYARTALLVFAGAAAVITVVMLAAPEVIARMTGLGAGRALLVQLLAVQVGLLSAYTFLAGLVNAVGAIGRLALLQSTAPAVTALAMYPAARALLRGGESELALMLVVAAGASVVAALWILRDYRAELRDWFGGACRWWSGPAAAAFLNVSLSMLIGGAAGSAALVAVRARIISAQGMAAAGQFDAAWGISMNQVMLVLTSMQAQYLPSLSQAGGAKERGAQISTVLNLAAIIAAPLIAIVTAAKPLVLTLLYSREFSEAGDYLRWMLIGDYLKISGWILSVPMLASADMRVYLVAEAAGYAVFVLAAALLARWIPPAEGAAMAFALMCAAHLVVCAVRAHTRYQYRPERSTLLLWVAGAALVVAAAWAHWNARRFAWAPGVGWCAAALGAGGLGTLLLAQMERKTS
jgi:O-antigen/teichoic acid export membrane protein